MRERLRCETSTLHQRIERALPLLSRSLTLAQYRRVLERFFGYYAPLESQLAVFTAMLPFAFRHRAPLLREDLLSLGAHPNGVAALPHCPTISAVATREHAAGCLYVVEGASLGGQAVARALRNNFGLTRESGVRFFIGEAEGTKTRWDAVVRWLDGLSVEGADADVIVGAAKDTFATLCQWMEAFDG